MEKKFIITGQRQCVILQYLYSIYSDINPLKEWNDVPTITAAKYPSHRAFT